MGHQYTEQGKSGGTPCAPDTSGTGPCIDRYKAIQALYNEIAVFIHFAVFLGIFQDLVR